MKRCTACFVQWWRIGKRATNTRLKTLSDNRSTLPLKVCSDFGQYIYIYIYIYIYMCCKKTCTIFVFSICLTLSEPPMLIVFDLHTHTWTRLRWNTKMWRHVLHWFDVGDVIKFRLCVTTVLQMCTRSSHSWLSVTAVPTSFWTSRTTSPAFCWSRPSWLFSCQTCHLRNTVVCLYAGPLLYAGSSGVLFIGPIFVERTSSAASWPSHLHQHLQTIPQNPSV